MAEVLGVQSLRVKGLKSVAGGLRVPSGPGIALALVDICADEGGGG